MLEITPANAFRIYSLPPSQLRVYLPKVFARLAVPAEEDSILVETYVGQLNQHFVDRREEGEGVGWSTFQVACVESGFFETFLSLAQHPRDDIETAVHYAWDSLAWLCFVSNAPQREALLEKAIAHDTLNLCLKWMKEGELCLHRHGAARLLRSLCQELYIGQTLTAPQTVELLHSLFRYVLEGVYTYAEELADPDKAWQIELMTDRFTPQPGAASKYGMRWFCLVQEYCMFAAHSLLCCLPPRSTQYLADMLKAKPAVVDLALDCARRPRPEWYPETQIDQLSTEVCAMLFQPPTHLVPSLPIPQDPLLQEEYTKEWQTAVQSYDRFVLRPALIPKIITAWKRLDDENFVQLRRSLGKVKSEWFGMQMSDDMIGDMYEMRGASKVAMLQLWTTLTYSPLCKDFDLISLLRIAYLTTKKYTPPSSDEFKPPGSLLLFEQHSCEYHEGITFTFRVPSFNPTKPDDSADAALQIPAAAVSAPYLLLRILTVLAERGLLEKIPQWKNVPGECVPGTDVRQVQQITSPAVIKKLLPVVAKRVTKHRELTRKTVADRMFYLARGRYRQAAELAAAMLAFDKATNGQWSEEVKGMWNELVLCLGNAAEMSNRHAEYKTALGFAVAADEAARAAPPNAGISADTMAKNERRARTARSKLVPAT